MNERIHHISPSTRKPDLPMGSAFDDTLAIIARKVGEQTVRLDLNTQELLKHQDTLAEQQAGLEHLVNDYYQLREQSQDGHRRVVALNKEIQGLRETLMRQVEEALASGAASVDARLLQSGEEAARLKTQMTEQIATLTGKVSALGDQLTALGERNDGVMTELGNTRRSLARYVDTKFAQHQTDQQKTAADVAEIAFAIDREISARKADLEQMEAAIAKQRELLDMQSRDIDARLGRLRDDMSTQRDAGQSRLKIVHVALAGLGVAVVGLLALVLVTM
ncbi:MAG: hypothetical protein RL654_1268 [Pseudomonadota bacterium]|jgi:predicted  nucleic acid-binding Zn-ribbon protein